VPVCSVSNQIFILQEAGWQMCVVYLHVEGAHAGRCWHSWWSTVLSGYTNF